MTYDLAFWDGPRPANDREVGEMFDELVPDDQPDDHEPALPTPRIAALVERLEARWPMTDEPPYPPWATWPIRDDADGVVLYVNLSFEAADASEEMAAIARELGLVCYDPQAECLV